MSKALDEYLEFERLMLILDEDGMTAAADALRDAMDLLWYRLDDGERQVLNDRSVDTLVSLAEIRLRVGVAIFDFPPTSSGSVLVPGRTIPGWLEAA
jgi:hypothetical protein